jgi:hypothetical protein
MHKIAIVIYSRLEGSGQSAVCRALMLAQELQRAGDDVVVVFGGGGSVTAAELAAPDHRLHALLQSVQVAGVCRHCAKSYGVLDTVQAAGLPLLADDRGHASPRALLEQGRQIVTF